MTAKMTEPPAQCPPVRDSGQRVASGREESRTFLRQVAEHYWELDGSGISGRCFVFPNRRSMVFFRKWLSDSIRGAETPVIAPKMYTINDFFYALARRRATPKVRLLLELYSCYDEIRRARGLPSEPLDEFVFWGDVILSDYNEIDKWMDKPDSLLRNVAELKAMQDDFSSLSKVLSEEQIKALEQFAGHFRGQTGNGSAPVKESFLQIWQMLLPLYRSFNSRLDSKGMSYEGMVYRSMAGRLCGGMSVIDLLSEVFDPRTGYVFVGLNALNDCEKTLMRKMRDARIAEFCWDYVSEEVRHPQNKSSFFMRDNVREFPQAFPLDPVDVSVREVDVLSVPSSVGQAKQLPEILSRIGGGPAGLETAVVLPDESLLIPVLNSIPSRISQVNVTMGYPMGGSAFYSLMESVAAMQLHLRLKDGEWMFYHKQAWAVLGSSVLKALMGERDKAMASDVRRHARYYIRQSEFAGSELLEAIFRPVVTDAGSASAGNTDALAQYLMDVTSMLGRRMTAEPSLALELEFARAYWQGVESLKGERLPVLPSTWMSLLRKVVTLDAVHFKGEPMRGMQVMGPLETRALDFRNLIILSCNEGIFPRHNVSASFIPHELRRAFGLPTYAEQDAVWAYYFYRLIQRASRVWLVYDSRLEGVRSGEESRYIKQLEMHFGVRTRRHVAGVELSRPDVEGDIPKTPEDVRVIRDMCLSASSLRSYLTCPAQFYYSRVKGLRPADEVSESLDAGMIGNVFHRTMQTLYSIPGGMVTRGYLLSILKDAKRVRGLVAKEICDELRADEVEGRNLVFEDIICKYVRQTVRRDVELMDREGTDHIEILGLELKVKDLEIDGFRFVCIIDRLDRLRAGEIRVVDYKTGKVLDSDVDVTDDNAQERAETLFDAATAAKDRPKIALQMYLYDEAVQKAPSMHGYCAPEDRVLNSVYSVTRLFAKPVEDKERSPRFAEETAGRLSALLREMSDTSVPFRRTSDRESCSLCDFKMICGR